MPAAESGSRHRQLALVATSAASIVAVVAAVALVAHPWHDTAAGSPAASASVAATSASGSASSTPSASSITASSPPVPSSTTPPVSHHTSSATTGVAGDNQINFKVSVQVSPTQVLVGQHVKVTITIVNEGGAFNRPVEMFFQGTDPSDDVSDPPPSCTARGAMVCPITGVRPGRTCSFTFTFIPGPFPAVGHFDDAVYAALNYTDSKGQEQQTPQYFAHVLLHDATASVQPPVSGAPSSTPTPSLPPASAAPTSATPAT